MDYKLKTDEEIKQLAVDTFAGKVFWMTVVKDDSMLRSVFLPLALMEHKQLEELATINPILYEYLDKAGNMAVGGYPTFFSMQWVIPDDYNKIVTKVKAIKEAVDKA